MPLLAVAVLFVGVLCAFDLLLTLAVIRRLREHTRRLAETGTMPPRMPQAGTPLGDFTATAVDGSAVSREFFSFPTVVGVFATGCTSCHEQLPAFMAYVDANDPKAVLAVVTGDAAEAERFADGMPPAATVVIESLGGAVTGALRVSQFPSFFIVDDDAVIVAAGNVPGGLPAVARA